jgi:hypothetical protein
MSDSKVTVPDAAVEAAGLSPAEASAIALYEIADSFEAAPEMPRDQYVARLRRTADLYRRGIDNAAGQMRHILEAAAPHLAPCDHKRKDES